jgi:indolepyruvate ferredoxin oxidoreductase alpha subunit
MWKLLSQANFQELRAKQKEYWICVRAKCKDKFMTSKIAADKPGSFALLNGDEAVARGAVEATVKVAASYPGTPATEILESIAEVSREFGIYAEWSINEIVAAEVAAGASMAGVRSIVSMKHVGLNVAADAAMTLAYTGVEGGMVIAVCDDPALHSSQNEQDTRFFAVHSKLPLLDAGSPQEAHDMAREAFEISEKITFTNYSSAYNKSCAWKSKS